MTHFVVIERAMEDDEYDEILNVWVFNDEDTALDHVKTMKAISEEVWNVDEAWRQKYITIRDRLFDEIVRPHLYKDYEAEVRQRLAAMIVKEIGERPGLDGMCGNLDVFKCEPGTAAELIPVQPHDGIA